MADPAVTVLCQGNSPGMPHRPRRPAWPLPAGSPVYAVIPGAPFRCVHGGTFPVERISRNEMSGAMPLTAKMANAIAAP